jgi:hypothetical protein
MLVSLSHGVETKNKMVVLQDKNKDVLGIFTTVESACAAINLSYNDPRTLRRRLRDSKTRMNVPYKDWFVTDMDPVSTPSYYKKHLKKYYITL